MSVQSEVNRLEQAKADIKTAMQAKGITVPSDATLDEYAELLAEMVVGIAFGGTGATNAAQARINLGITLANLGVTATATELNRLDGITATTAELNYVDGVTSAIQTQFNSKSPTNHTHSNMAGASSSANGIAGFVPAPIAGSQSKYLRGDGTWQTPTNTTYGVATTSKNGLMSATDKSKLDSLEETTAIDTTYIESLF